MYCEECGKEVENGDLYCNNCGNRLEESVKMCRTPHKEEEKIKRKINTKIVLGIIFIIGIGITSFIVTQSHAVNINPSSNTKNEAETAKSSITSDKNNKSVLTAEKTKEYNELDVKKKNDTEARETFAKLIQDEGWLAQNVNYKDSGSVKFLILDIDQDGIPEMLLSNQSGSLASYMIAVVTYNNGNVNVQKINTSHGGFAGYLSDEKVFLINGEQMGYSWGIGYKLEGNQYKEIYRWEDNIGTGKKELIYKLNSSQVSEAEYKSFTKRIGNINPEAMKFYEINKENIKKYLEVD